ncbi:hypothetical protein BVRB_030780, partial [Beta vulgaris subsp. vulgaris]
MILSAIFVLILVAAHAANTVETLSKLLRDQYDHRVAQEPAILIETDIRPVQDSCWLLSKFHHTVQDHSQREDSSMIFRMRESFQSE